ncbi:uncharacterized protein LOC120164001 [Hibiscus syriacus]|uniref:uncharacterized protein LOC120164001 n=1 Tax=Hibiscus syriacus TaxID=106335 RepID=UPI0019206888|nr:uncharacterized protein LOC120164001 [Hibiscus syriacus]
MDMEMGSQSFGHDHPMVFNDVQSNQTKEVTCSRCGEMVFGSSFSCSECEFYLHKKCAEAPPEIRHPYHRDHPLVLLPKSPYEKGRAICNFCGKTCEKFIYHCSCELDLHVKCALLSFDIAEKVLGELKRVPLKVPLVSADDNDEELERAKCFVCREPLLGSMHFSPDCGFNLHKKCVELPPKINYPLHKDHPLFLQMRIQGLSCNLCHRRLPVFGFNYSCSPCKFALHITCAELPPTLDLPCHRKHPLVLAFQNNPSCDACKETQRGWYKVIEARSLDDLAMVPRRSVDPIICIEKNKDGEMTEIKHFSHAHNLILQVNLMKEHREGSNLMEKYCDGCVLPVSNPFYHCSQCDFFLHKECAELPMEKQLWFHICQRFLILVADHIFRCGLCRSECNGFSYRCKECDIYYCLHCATRSYTIEHPSHEHPLYYDRNHKGRCSACDVTRRGLFRCKHCKISLHIQCLRQPLTAWHGCDEHLLALTYKEVSTYSQYLYCDICERKRDSNRWFYCCASCDVSVHLDCALGRYPFIKPGSIYRGLEDHPHPLTFVKKTFSCPGCHKCGIPCRDLCLECEDSTCGYVVHWDCAKPSHLKNQKIVLDTTETDESIPKGSVPNSSCVVLVRSFANF